jgi:micrococcal nuclease
MGFWSWLFGEKTKATRIEHLKVLDVIDGDTIHVDLRGEKESLRLCCIDTEESRGGGNKPVTKAGKMASDMAKAYFMEDGEGCYVDIEFETDDLESVCLEKHRDTYGRLICYVFKFKENYNLKCVQEGWSPYFLKYGHSRLYHEEFVKAEEDARAEKLVIWDPKTNEGGPSRNYEALLPWWRTRGKLVKQFREQGAPAGALDAREDYPKIIESLGSGERLTVFCDLQGGIRAWPGDGAVVDIGTETRRLSLWIPDAANRKELTDKIDEHYAGRGPGYCYVAGDVTDYKGKPQIVVKDVDQLRDSV